jgi:hypothetical protein
MRAVVASICLVACRYSPPIPGTPADADPADSFTIDPDAELDAMPDPEGGILIEAEAFTTMVSRDGVHEWTVEASVAGFTGTGYVVATPATTTQETCDPAELATCGCVAEYPVTIVDGGMYEVTIRHASPNPGADSIHWAIDGVLVTDNLDPDVTGVWVNDLSKPAPIAIAPGAHVFQLLMRENGARIDSMRLTRLR